ncbi:MAG: phosphatase [Sporomusaceae bacterium]|nr:phosphatase [Sporomusaceae bacterium]
MMQFIADLHVHSVASGHAYSTVTENIRAAAERGLEVIALTDHGPKMPGGPHEYYFGNLRVIPERLFGVRVLKGVEANIMDREGTLDLEDGRLAQLDIVLAGLHTYCAPYGSVEENTRMLINAIKHPRVDGIVHPGNPEYPVDFAAIVRAAVEFDVALEINNSSLTVSRKGSLPFCNEIAALVRQYGAKVILGTDSHFSVHVGDFGAAVALLEKNDIGAEQVLNTSRQGLAAHLNRRGRRLVL